MIESENHNQNPFIVTLKILSLASKEIPQVPSRLYDLNLTELLVSCLKIIHDSPENTPKPATSSKKENKPKEKPTPSPFSTGFRRKLFANKSNKYRML